MDSKLNNLPPMKRFRLLQQQTTQKPDSNPSQSPISPSRLPTKKRTQSRSPPFYDENPYSLPAKKRIWAFQPDSSPLSEIDLNVEYTSSPDKKLIKDDNYPTNYSLPAKKRIWAFRPESPEKKPIKDDKDDDEDDDEDGIKCGVCESTDGDPIDPIVFCDGCDLMVHSSCYGNPLIKSIPEGNWFCLQCSDKNSSAKCCLCPVTGGAMKCTSDGKWAHIVCAVFVPEVFFIDSEGRDGIDCSVVPKRRWNQVCYLCKKRHGCVVDCSEPNCPLSFHVTCGLEHDLCIELNQRSRRSNGGGGCGGGGIVAAFCRKHTEIWNKQQQTGKFKIVARNEE